MVGMGDDFIDTRLAGFILLGSEKGEDWVMVSFLIYGVSGLML